jgi:sulfide:quinone oxidoreductase
MDKLVYITPTFAVAAQLSADDFAEVAALGFTTVVNHRPDGEDQAQLASALAGVHAARAGLTYHYIPAGKLDLFSDPVVGGTETALAAARGPVLAYCKSGMRSSIIWAAATARRNSVDQVLAVLTAAGYDYDFLREDLDEQAARASLAEAA